VIHQWLNEGCLLDILICVTDLTGWGLGGPRFGIEDDR
jgi:hypothetical protein